MIDTAAVSHPVPRALHVGFCVALGVILFPVVLGQIVTTVRAGMADPVWPTEPWYLLSNFKLDFGYLVEHVHRIAGFVLGGVLGVLTIPMWWTDPRKTARWVGVIAVVVLVVGFGEFHNAVMKQNALVKEDASLTSFTVPMVPVAVMAAAVFVLLAVGGGGLIAGVRGSGLRLFTLVVLLAVMTQGILGGARVLLHALVGPELAAIHGGFAQMVFALLIALVVLTARYPRTDISKQARGPVAWLSLILVGVLFTQLVLGVLVRHQPTALAQRLHFLTAFVAVAIIVWLLRVGFGNAATRVRVAPAGWVLGVLVAAQVILGVEAWMGKFSQEAWEGQQASSYLPAAQAPTLTQAAIRTTHAFVGTGVWGAAVALALGVRRRRGGLDRVAFTPENEFHAVATEPRPKLAATVSSQSGEST